MPTPAAGPLDGVVIADFSRVLAGPYCTMVLGDLGATVIKIEGPGGDETRDWMPPSHGDRSTYYLSVNRNKRSIALDLTVAEDRSIARRIIARSHVLVENLLPGRMASFGLGWEDLRSAHPGLVYASLSGFGDLAGADLPGYDLLAQAMSGFMSITGQAGGAPQKAGFAVMDVLAGLHLSTAILAALRHSERTGEGQWVKTDLLSAALSSMANQSGATAIGGVVPTRLGNAHPSIFPYELFATATRELVLAVGNDRQFRRLCEVIGLPELADHTDFGRASERSRNRDRLRPMLAGRLITGPAEEWVRLLREAAVPCGVVQDLAGGFALAEQLLLEPVAMVEGEPTVRNPVRYSATPPSYRLAPPDLDSGRGAIVQWLDDPSDERLSPFGY